MNKILLLQSILALAVRFCFAIEKRAFVTVVTCDDDVESAMAMGTSLRALTRTADSVHNPSYSLEYVSLFLLKEEKSDDENGNVGIDILGVKKLEFAGWKTARISHSISNADSESPKWSDRDFNNIWLWSLSQFNKVVFVDTDVLILQDIKDLFDNDAHFAAAPQTFASNKFDSGLMLLRPDMSTFTEMTSKLKSGIESSWIFQDFVNDYFSEWYSMSPEHRLLPTYNAPYAWTFHEESWPKYRSDIKAIHFTGEEKPWLILKDPNKFKVSVFGAPLIYLWAILLFFIANPLGDGLEDETRYVMMKVFDITKTSQNLAQYIAKVKRGGTRLRIGIHDKDEKVSQYIIQ